VRQPDAHAPRIHLLVRPGVRELLVAPVDPAALVQLPELGGARREARERRQQPRDVANVPQAREVGEERSQHGEGPDRGGEAVGRVEGVGGCEEGQGEVDGRGVDRVAGGLIRLVPF